MANCEISAFNVFISCTCSGDNYISCVNNVAGLCINLRKDNDLLVFLVSYNILEIRTFQVSFPT